MKAYKVIEQYVDFPMGVSPAYSVRSGLTKEEAINLVKTLNAKQKKREGSVYRVYSVKEE